MNKPFSNPPPRFKKKNSKTGMAIEADDTIDTNADNLKLQIRFYVKKDSILGRFLVERFIEDEKINRKYRNGYIKDAITHYAMNHDSDLENTLERCKDNGTIQ